LQKKFGLLQNKIQTEQKMVLLTDGNMCEKMTAHLQGLSHYALSIFIFNEKGEMLLQKRAEEKYHSGGLWTNACCTHPISTDLEQVREAAASRLQYEMGIDCTLEYIFQLPYRVECESLIEDEYNFVFVGKTNSEPVINPEEVSGYKWCCPKCIDEDRTKFPNKYTPWFHLLLDKWKEYQ
jgi:isopentenyl-diphosphate delta-isomerase